MIKTLSEIRIFQKGTYPTIEDKEAPMFYKDGRSARRLNSFFIASQPPLPTNDDPWFYLNPIEDNGAVEIVQSQRQMIRQVQKQSPLL